MKPLASLDVEYYNSETGGHPTQVAILGENGEVLFNKYFRVDDPSIKMSHEKKKHLKSKKTESWPEYKHMVASILKYYTVVGHDLQKDFKAMGIPMQEYDTIDTSKIQDYMRIVYEPQKLKQISKEFLKRNIQISATGIHDALEDAKAALDLVKLYQSKTKSNNIPDLLSFVEAPSDFARDIQDFEWNSLPTNTNTNTKQSNNGIDKFLNIPYANRSFPLLQSNTKTRKNYTKNLEGLVYNTVPPANNNTLNTFLNRPYTNTNSSSALLQFPPPTRKNYTKDLEGLAGPTIPRRSPNRIETAPNMNVFLNIPYANRTPPLLQFPTQTRKNYTKDLEGLEMPLTLQQFVGTPRRKNGRFKTLKSYIKKITKTGK